MNGTERQDATRAIGSAANPETSPGACPFCERLADRTDLPRSKQAAVIHDAFPRARGHLLIIPVAHIPNYFDLADCVKADLWALVDSAKSYLSALYGPDGWTVRINVGEIAGQTVNHTHIHLIPHYTTQ